MTTRTPRFVSLSRKFRAALLGITLLALALSLLLGIFPMFQAYRQDVRDKGLMLSGLLAASCVAALDFEDPQAAAENLASLELVSGVHWEGAAVYTADGRLFASYGRVPAFLPADRPLADMRLDELTAVHPIASAAHPASLHLLLSLGDQWTVLLHKCALALLLLGAVFTVCVKAAGYYRRKLTDPLLGLIGALSEISRDKDYARRLEYRSNDEVGLLVAECNTLLEKVLEHDRWQSSQHEVLENLVAERTRELTSNQAELERKNRQLLVEMRAREKAEMIRAEVERINRHDLKSALNLVIGYPDLLLREGGLSGEQEAHIRRIRAAGYRMLDMITNHLDIFKMEKGLYTLRRTSVDLVEIVCGLEEEFAPLCQGQGIVLDIRLDGAEVVGSEMFCVAGEAPLLRAMLRNLIQNAIEASVPGERVGIHMEGGAHRQVSVHNSQAVPREIRQRFFEKYVTCGKEGGTGLGTYFAALVARTHGASISVHTDEAHGTTVRVLFRDEPGPCAQS